MITKSSRREYYSKRLARKQEELAAIEGQLAGFISKKDELKLNRDVEKILEEIEELEKKLSQLDENNISSNVQHLSLEKSFQKIDFSDAKRIAQSINTNLGDASGAVLLFLQRSTKQKGNYCLDEVLDLIVSDRKVGKDIIGDFRTYPVDLGSSISELNEAEFSKRLASHLGSNSEEGLHDSIKRLCISLRGGSTVFIKVENWDRVLDREKFLGWFIKEFWELLIGELAPIFEEYSKIRFIVALIAKSQVFQDCSSLPHYFCTEDKFESCKAVELPLRDWTVDDIKKWLVNFRGLSKSKSQDLAVIIYDESEGTPDTICSILQREFMI